MDKRYQVFVSSTFADLQDERSNVIQTLMEMDCIPAGMELFPALDEEQFEFIKKVIDDSDYYLLIIGGRYGSLSDDGISYTEMEYDYAISKGIKVIALVHGSPEKLAVEKVEIDSKAQEKLKAFKTKATTNRLVKFWNDAKELPGLVALSLPKTIKTYPAVGWVRASEATDNTDLLKQLNELRQDKDKLEKHVQELQKNKNEVMNLAKDDDSFIVHLSIIDSQHSWEEKITWKELFQNIGPKILTPYLEYEIFEALAYRLVIERHEMYRQLIDGGNQCYAMIDTKDQEMIKIQLLSLGYIELLKHEGHNNFWQITPKGKEYLLSSMAIKRVTNEENN